MRLKCAIIDDEPLARECIENYVAKVDFLQLIGTGNNPLELNHILEQQSLDLVFLDIQMPVINGIDYLKSTPNSPMVIITTAYPSFALDGFQLDVMDYLLKPITFDRFFKAVNKAKDYFSLRNKSSALTDTVKMEAGEDYFFIKCDAKYEKIYLQEILYIQALENYVSIYTTKRKYLTLLNLKNVEENLDKQSFMKVHKSYIVSIPRIDAIENNEILIQSSRVPISRNYKEAVIERVVNRKLWKKFKEG
jgi:DNA-binding LytR/AlgR family response regulator